MKVLLFTDNYNLQGGGAEKVFFKLINELKKAKLDVYSFGFGKKKIKENDHIVIKETNSLLFRHLWRLLFNPVKYLQIRNYIKKINPDVIHIHNINKYTISLLIALRGYKVIQTVHDYGLVCPTLWNVHNDLKPCPTGLRFKCLFKHKRDYNIFIYLSMLLFFYQRNLLLKKIVNCFITPAPQLKKYLDKNGFKNVKFIPNIINIKENIKPNFNKINYNQILYLGQLERNKGVHILINEMKYVVKNHPSVILKIAGSGSEKENLIKLVNKLNLSKNIKFIGWVNGVGNLIQESAFLVVPSIWMENAPITICEAIFYSRTTIGSNRGGIPWLIKDGISGEIFNINEQRNLAKKINNLLNNKTKIIKQGKESKKFKRYFLKAKILKGLKKLYI